MKNMQHSEWQSDMNQNNMQGFRWHNMGAG